MCYVSNGTLVRNQVVLLRVFQVLLKHTVETPCLVLVAVDAVLDRLRCVAKNPSMAVVAREANSDLPEEVIGLPLHGTDTSVQEEQPVIHLVVLACAWREADLEVLVISGYDVLHHAARLEEADLLAVIEGVCHGRNATVGVDLEEPWFLLCVLRDVDPVNIVWEAILGQLLTIAEGNREVL